MVQQISLDNDFGIALWHIVLEFAINKNSVRRDGDRRGFFQPYVTINSRAFVKPAFEF